MLKIDPVISIEEFKKVVEDEKLNLVMMAMNTINESVDKKFHLIITALNLEVDGVFPRLRDCESAVEDYKERVEQLKETNELLKNDVTFLKGVVQVQERQIEALTGQMADIKIRSMRNNITISGLKGDHDGENCNQKALNFIKEKLEMDTSENDIQVAHRVGDRNEQGNPRQMVVRCSEKLRQNNFGHTKKLKGKKNSMNKSYFVDPQLPEGAAVEHREVNYQIKKVNRYNSSCAPEHRVKYQVKQRALYVNNQKQRKAVVPPTNRSILTMSREEYDWVGSLEMAAAEPIEDMGSVFTSYAVKVHSPNAIADYYKAVKIWHPECDHIVMAYHINAETVGCCDNGEHFAGLKVQRVLEEREDTETVVFIAREFGCKHLGPKRFTRILNQARTVLNKLN